MCPRPCHPAFLTVNLTLTLKSGAAPGRGVDSRWSDFWRPSNNMPVCGVGSQQLTQRRDQQIQEVCNRVRDLGRLTETEGGGGEEEQEDKDEEEEEEEEEEAVKVVCSMNCSCLRCTIHPCCLRAHLARIRTAMTGEWRRLLARSCRSRVVRKSQVTGVGA